MPGTTQSAYIHEGDWDQESDAHPASGWMREYTNAFDTVRAQTQNDFSPQLIRIPQAPDKLALFDKYIANDFEYVKADGSTYPKGRESWAAVAASYQLLSEWWHEPYFFSTWENKDGSYSLTGNAWVWQNLPGGNGSGQQHTDKNGKKWDIRTPGGFYFRYQKQPDGGLKMDRMSITSDSGPTVVTLLQRGVLKPQDLGLQMGTLQ